MIDVKFKMSGNYDEFLKSAPDKVDKALEMAAREFPQRMQPKAKQAIKAHYSGTRPGDISAAARGGRSSGKEGILTYEGGVLPVSHFNMSPTSNAGRSSEMMGVPGISWRGATLYRVRRPVPYSISFTVKSGTSLPASGAGFFVYNSQAFVREGTDSIRKLNTLSVPAMVWNDARSEIEEQAQEVHADRVWHHLQQAFG